MSFAEVPRPAPLNIGCVAWAALRHELVARRCDSAFGSVRQRWIDGCSDRRSGVEFVTDRWRDVSAGVEDAPDIHDLITDDVEHQIWETSQRTDA